jgi:hypothetical protein
VEAIVPVTIGVVSALVLIAVVHFGERYFDRHPLTHKQYSLLFAAFAALFFAGAIACWGSWWAFAASLLVSGVNAWGALGKWFEWPGFRPEPDPEDESMSQCPRSKATDCRE